MNRIHYDRVNVLPSTRETDHFFLQLFSGHEERLSCGSGSPGWGGAIDRSSRRLGQEIQVVSSEV